MRKERKSEEIEADKEISRSRTSTPPLKSTAKTSKKPSVLDLKRSSQEEKVIEKSMQGLDSPMVNTEYLQPEMFHVQQVPRNSKQDVIQITKTNQVLKRHGSDKPDFERAGSCD